MRAFPILAATLTLALAACSANPTTPAEWPVNVVPAAGQLERSGPDRLVVLPPDCGAAPATVSKMRGTSWHNPDLGLGCSQARNLALQVDQPRDLLAGRTTGSPDAEREAKAIDRYHKGEEKDLQRAGTRSSFGAATTTGSK